jgi:hypothetical protein
MNSYVRSLFDVAGQGPTLRRLEWKAVATHREIFR